MKKIKSEGAVKSKTPYKMKFIKKVATIASAVVLSAALFLGAAFTLTGCNNEKDPIDPNPPIVDPIPDPEPEPDPDPEPEPEPDPDPDPEPDPDPNPDPDPEPEPEPDPDPEPPVIEPEPVDDLVDLYMEEPVAENYEKGEDDPQFKADKKQYENAQAMQKAIYQNLEANVKDNMLYKYFGNDWSESKILNTKWELGSSNNNEVIDTVRIFFTYNNSSTMDTYYIESVTPKSQITLEDLANNEVNYDEAFDTAPRGGAKFSKEYEFSYDPAASEQRKELLDAINNKVVGEVSEDTISIIRPNGGTTDPELGGTANAYKILNITENGYEEYSINILDSSNGKSEIENLNNGKYYTYSEKSETYGNHFLDASVLENEITQQQNKNVKYVAKVSLPKEDGTVEEFEIEL